MRSPLKTRLIRIGNSKGIRIPKAVLEHVGLSGELELEVKSDHLVLRPSPTTRRGWDETFQSMAEFGDDQLLDAEAPSTTSWDTDEWQW